MKVTFYGHGCFGVEMNGKHLLFDPFIRPNELAAGIDVETVKADYILVTHGHEDHIADVEFFAKKHGATVVSNFEIVSYFGKMGIKGHPMNHGGKWHFDFGTVKYVNAIHSSSFPDGSYAGNPGGFVVWDDAQAFYFAGDTALTMDMKLIPMTCPKLSFSIFPLGDNFTMNYEEAVIATDFVECDTVVGCHYDTFGYIKMDKNDARNAFNNRGKKLLLPEIGETLVF